MGLIDFFRKKEPELDINANLGLNSNSDISSGLGNDFGNPSSMNPALGNDFGQGFHEQMAPSVNLSSQQFQPAQQMSGVDIAKDIQIISLKLDAIKTEIDSMNQRIKNIEAIAEREQVQQPKKWY